MTSENVYEPMVSVIIPTVNAEVTIKDLLDSLVEIDYDRRKFEVIVVDGGSTDRTRDIVQMYPVKLVSERRRGINVARNAGIKNSRGEILAFTDSDCIVPKDWIKRIVENFKDSEVGCLGGNVSRYEDDFLSIYADNSIMPVLRRFKKREILDNVELLFRYPAGCNMAFRRSAIEKVNAFDEDIQYGFDEDELAERVCKSGYKMVLDSEVVIKHRHRDTVTDLLKQMFNYGRGGVGLLKRKARGRFSTWILLSLILFSVWLLFSFSLLFFTIAVNIVFVLPLLSITFVPFLLLTLFYMHKTWGKEESIRVATYPLIDLLRLFAFHLGGIYELINVEKTTQFRS